MSEKKMEMGEKKMEMSEKKRGKRKKKHPAIGTEDVAERSQNRAHKECSAG